MSALEQNRGKWHSEDLTVLTRVMVCSEHTLTKMEGEANVMHT